MRTTVRRLATIMSRPPPIAGGGAIEKGKAREHNHQVTPSLDSLIDEAISSPLPPPVVTSDSSFGRPSPISTPPQAHYPSMATGLGRHRLVSQLTRSILPTAGLSYDKPGESSSPRRRVHSMDGFPDLDTATGLPLEPPNRSPLQLQRTITGLLEPPAPPSGIASYLPSLPKLPDVSSLSPNLPKLPNMSSLSISMPGSTSRSSPDLKRTDYRRSISSSAPKEDWGTWAAGWIGGKKSKDSMLSKEDQADTAVEDLEHIQNRTPQYPLVFCHGLLGFDVIGPTSLPPLQISHWRGIREVLESNGVEVLITRVPATASIADRAAILDEVISEKYAGKKINLIGHSMGGLDCRYLVSEIQPKKYTPVSVTTVSTPHRGSPFADYLIDNVVGRERLPSLLSILETLRLPQSGDGSAFASLGTKSMKEFNAQVVDQPDVQYYSWGAAFDPGLLDTFKWPHSVILSKEGPNDGLVSVQSAQWGEYRGTLLGVNHLDLVGWVNQVRYAFAGWTGRPITFKPATFYLEISDYLAEQGF